MSESIIVRVSLDSYDIAHPAEKQTQVYVQIPEVGRASWLLDAGFYAVLKNEPWPHVVDEAHNDYVRRGVVSDSASAAARQAIVDWLLLSEGADYDARYDAVQAAWEADQARQHPVARKLLAENEKLRSQVAALLAERHSTNESLSLAAESLREQRDRIAELEAARSADRLTRIFAPTQTLQPVPLRWGLNDVEWCDDDSVIVLLSGPDREPYRLELEPSQAAVLREDLAGPEGPAGYRAMWDTEQVGPLYGREPAARAHCEHDARFDYPEGTRFAWRMYEESVAELVVVADGEETRTGYTVTRLPLPSEFTPEDGQAVSGGDA